MMKQKEGLLEWSKNEVNLLLESTKGTYRDYLKGCCEDALKLLDYLSEEPRSLYAYRTIEDIFHKVLYFEPLTPLRGTDDEWKQIAHNKEDISAIYANKRLNNVYKFVYKDGHTEIKDFDRIIYRDPNLNSGSFYFTFADDCVNEVIPPIEFPYTREQVIVTVQQFMFDEEDTFNDFDTVAIIDAKIGENTYPIDRYFKVIKGTGFHEITEEEYFKRRMKLTLRRVRK